MLKRALQGSQQSGREETQVAARIQLSAGPRFSPQDRFLEKKARHWSPVSEVFGAASCFDKKNGFQ
jgi:hypothetical protein